MRTKLIVSFILICSNLVFGQTSGQLMQKWLYFPDSAAKKLQYLRNDKGGVLIGGTSRLPQQIIYVRDSAYSLNVLNYLTVITKGGKNLAMAGVSARGEFFVSGRKEADSNDTFSRFFSASKDSVRTYLGGVEALRLQGGEFVIHKALVLEDLTVANSAPNLVLRRLNSASSGIDSGVVSLTGNILGQHYLSFSVPMRLGEYTGSTNLSAYSIGYSGTSLIVVPSAAQKMTVDIIPGTPGQVLGYLGTNTIGPMTDATGGGGGGGAPASLRFELADGSFTHYPDSLFKADSNFTMSSGLPYTINIGLKNGLNPTGTNTFYKTTLSNSLVIKNSGGKLATITHAAGFNDPNFAFPNINGSYTLATTTGSTFSGASTWNGVPIGFDYYQKLDRSMTIDTLNSLYTNKHLTRFWTFDSGLSAKSYTLQNPSFTGSTVLSQDANNRLTFTNTDLVQFATTNGIQFFNGTFTGTVRLAATMTGNRTYNLPNGSGTFPTSTTSPIALDATTGVLSFASTFVASLNGLTGQTQTFTTGSLGSAPNIVSSGTIHQFNFPLAGAGVTSGTASNGTQSFDGLKTMLRPFTAQAERIGYTKITNTVFSVAQEAAYYHCDPSVNGSMAMNLPNITSEPRAKYTFWRFTNGVGSNTVTIIPFASERIDGKSSIVLTQEFDYITIANTGTSGDGWKVVGGVVDGAPYGRSQAIPVVGFLRSTTDSCDISVPGMTTGGTAVFNFSDASVSPVGTLNTFCYTNRIAIKSTYDNSKDSVKIIGFYSK